MTKNLTMTEKLKKLSPKLRSMIQTQEERDRELKKFLEFASERQNKGVITKFFAQTMLHCNAGATIESAIWLKKHLDNGGKLVVTLAGALSSFQVGVMLAELIRKGKVHLVSATGANHEESFYRHSAHSHYAYIPNYTELTPEQEMELRDAGLRRITDTFLPEDESVRIIEPHLHKMWLDAVALHEKYFPHEYFRNLYRNKLIKPDPKSNPMHSWTLAASEKNIPIVVPGFEDSTMGNIFSSYSYVGKHKERDLLTVESSVMKTGPEYMHLAYDWYMDASKDAPIAFLQLGGGIAADFIICVVPSLKHDLMIKKVRDWAGFIEVGSSPMSYGSYSGAGGKEKITWDKLSTKSYYKIIQSDATLVFPIMAAVLLGK
ncbi:MAG: Homospermidine synthase (Spermidine-specific) [Candidatus Nomurabacteria bacterium GW2011_GWB1_37_5]|uniref:Homospermidine synthase (Spermidine-specific) n=1 Tax=Candidatus Nomurabacteria bacterium GW2011_GWB1_37_5 TaxID=1618742 RepID=A0A0G0K428_9BACT|nr:MAG: Homospermidine synthase (Spermidine-specific) [Candidatus Nomurabacteria bacterium GW2011_GWB1_37_5]